MIFSPKWRRWRIWPAALAALGFTTFLIGTFHLQRLDYISPAMERSSFHLPEEKLLVQPDETSLINLHDFRYIINNPSTCSGSDVYVLTLVHSSPSHFSARNAIRATWGGMRKVADRHLRTIFLLGTTSERVQALVDKENEIHRDLVQGSFVDTYANLTYKHIMGHKWVTRYCNRTKFVLKTDEDVFVDVRQFVHYLMTLYADSPLRTLICNVYPTGTPTRREGKWNVSVSDYPFGAYPCYCAGLAYVVTPDVSRDFNAASAYVPFFWIDDVYVTGFLAEALQIRHLSLNFRLSMSVDSIDEWLRSNSSHPSPYLIVGIGDVPAWTRLLRVLWDKTLASSTEYVY